MTSKEALNCIKREARIDCWIYADKPIYSQYYREYIEPIEKDLEVLVLLKENIIECVGDSAGNEYLKLLFHKFDNEEKYNKLKEWLEK